METKRISFIGCGNMARSLIGGLIANGHPAAMISGADPDPAQRDQIKSLFGIQVDDNNVAALKDTDVLVLAVKPQVLQNTLTALNMELQENTLLISIAAGIRLSAIEQWLQKEIPVVRVMPNTPALIQAGAAALCANEHVSTAEKEIAESIMRSVGLALWLEDESQLDAVTALSGSGPAYFFLIMEVMEKAAVKLGLPKEQARLLTLETALGASKMALESDIDAATLRQQVTSPGGTTEQALKVFTDAGIEKIFQDALQAAHDRSVELAQEFGDDT